MKLHLWKHVRRQAYTIPTIEERFRFMVQNCNRLAPGAIEAHPELHVFLECRGNGS